MEMKLELVVMPFSDLDRARRFYADQLGFNLDHEVRVSDEHRVVQLTPPGSACSIALQTRPPSGTVDTPPLRRLQLVTPDVQAARALLVARGVGVSKVQLFQGGSFRPAREGDPLDYSRFVFFSDPEGNAWALQQLPGRD
jgi:catechol 2,3-dioxygenase-like lactoylglutathione lyase family enzyme